MGSNAEGPGPGFATDAVREADCGEKGQHRVIWIEQTGHERWQKMLQAANSSAQGKDRLDGRGGLKARR